MDRPNWIVPEPLVAEPALHPDRLLSAILYRRGFRERAAVAEFLGEAPAAPLDPHRLPGLIDAADRVAAAVARGAKIGVFGDYDADGVCATALLASLLHSVADPARIAWRLPLRKDGYGLSFAAVDEFAAQGVELLIAVDCGSANHAEIGFARDLGMEVVVLDHHQLAGAPPAGATLASARLAADPSHAYGELTAVGVVHVLAQALAERLGEAVAAVAAEGLDLVALGTVADVAPVTGVNRPLVRAGLAAIRQRPRPGLAALCRRAGVEPATLPAGALAFKLAPRLNAAGRMGDPALALALLLTRDLREADRLAGQLEELNTLRKRESERILREAEELLTRRPGWRERKLLLVTGPDWPKGLVGIAAAQLAERHGRPAVVLAREDRLAHGSARSVPGLDITAALAGCSGLLRHHGGHSQAAGLSLEAAKLEALEAALLDWLETAERDLGIVLPRGPELKVDARLPLRRLSLATARALATLEPFGPGNEAPLLLIPGARVVGYDALGAERRHLALRLIDPKRPGAPVRAVMWGAAGRSSELLQSPTIDAVVAVGVGRWNGAERLEVEVKDFRPAEGAAPG